MVVAANIDFLLTSFTFRESIAAVAGCSGSFNSGLMIAKPSVNDLTSLLELVKHVRGRYYWIPLRFPSLAELYSGGILADHVQAHASATMHN